MLFAVGRPVKQQAVGVRYLHYTTSVDILYRGIQSVSMKRCAARVLSSIPSKAFVPEDELF